ncbi:protein PXR1-like [Nicotiana tomentosiformis]|uniref:protein PXR1-like n=1 Tax=Nicotiana tomentosiformis TaxID=4098 RepID=UPI00388CB4E4
MNLKETEKKKTERNWKELQIKQPKKTKKENKRKTKANESSEANGENKQVTKKVASEGKGKEDYGSLDDNEHDSKGTERGNSVSTGDDEGCSKKVASGDEAKMSLEKIATEGKDKPELSHKKKKKKKKESAEQADSVGYGCPMGRDGTKLTGRDGTG